MCGECNSLSSSYLFQFWAADIVICCLRFLPLDAIVYHSLHSLTVGQMTVLTTLHNLFLPVAKNCFLTFHLKLLCKRHYDLMSVML